MNKYSLKQLKNGLRVVMIPNKSTSAVTVLVLIKVGSRQEAATNSGVSHFVEHMMFKGTKKRPRPIDIPIELEGVGAEFNAFTGKEYTGYYIKLASDKLDLALDILSDMLLTSKFSQSELAKERGVILEEINMYEDSPRATVDHMYESLVYKGHSLSRKIIGPKKVIKSITRAELLRHKNKFYNTANAVIAVAGNISNPKAIVQVEKYFKKFAASKQPQPINKFKNAQKESQVTIKTKATEQIHLALGFPGYHNEDPKAQALGVLSVILGGGMSSRLFVEAREKRGLCYNIYASSTTYEDCGDIMVKAGLDTARLIPAIELIIAELKKFKKVKVSNSELQRAKEYMKGSAVLSLEDSESQASWYSREVLFGEAVLTPAQKLAKLSKVTAKDIQEVARELFQTNKANLAIIGPIRSANKIKLEKLLVF